MDRALYINNQLADIDEKTAIGMTWQLFDFANPGQFGVAYTNSATLPGTPRNLEVLGWPGYPGLMKPAAYQTHRADYFVGSSPLFENAVLRIDAVEDGRITVGITARPSFWDLLKDLSWNALEQMLFDDLAANGEVYTEDSPYEGSPADPTSEVFTQFVGSYVALVGGNVRDLNLHYYLGALSADSEVNESESNLYLAWQQTLAPSSKWKIGGHFDIKVRRVFEIIGAYTGWDVSGGGLWSDPVFSELVVNLTRFTVRGVYTSRRWWVLYQPVAASGETVRDATAYDFVKAVMQLLNLVPEHPKNQGNRILFRRFEEVASAPSGMDFGKNITPGFKFVPYVEGTAQKNYIGFESVYEGGTARAGAKLIQSYNLALPAEKDLFKINAHLPFVREHSTGGYFLALSDTNSTSKFVFMLPSNVSFSAKFVYAPISSTGNSRYFTQTFDDVIAVDAYSPANEYAKYSLILEKPEVYTIKKFLSINELNTLSSAAGVYSVPSLGGSFIISKIEGFNPLSKDPCTVELVKVNSEVVL